MEVTPGADAAPATEERFALLARWWPPLAALVAAAITLGVARSPYRAADTYFHLRLGQEFLSGDWSIAHPGHPGAGSSADWVPTQWLPETGLAWVADHLGDHGLAAVLASLTACFAGAVYLLLRRVAAPAAASAAGLLVLLGTLPYLSLRPQVLSYLLFVAVLALWHRGAVDGRAPWLLIPTTWLWAMCHGMWIVGVGASAVLAVGVVWQRRPPRRSALAHLAVAPAMLVAACATPVGPRLVRGVVEVGSRASHFAEWRAPELLTPTAAPITALLLLAVLALVRAPAVAPFWVAVLALGGVLAIYSTRTLPLAALALAFALVAAAHADDPGSSSGRRPRPLASTAAVVALATAAAALASTLSLRPPPAAALAPLDAALAALPADTAVLTDRESGTILLRTHPRLDVTIHAYGDLYTDRELEAYDALARLDPGWRDTLDRLAPRRAVLPDDAPLADALLDDGWRTEERAGRWLLLAPPASFP